MNNDGMVYSDRYMIPQSRECKYIAITKINWGPSRVILPATYVATGEALHV